MVSSRLVSVGVGDGATVQKQHFNLMIQSIKPINLWFDGQTDGRTENLLPTRLTIIINKQYSSMALESIKLC